MMSVVKNGPPAAALGGWSRERSEWAARGRGSGGTDSMNILSDIVQDYIREDVPEFSVGDTLKVHIKIKEGARERIQVFEGFVLKKQGGGVSETFTVRRIASGVGVEKTFPINSPKIDRIEVVKHGDVRRAKLNYMRQRTGKAARIKSKERD
jgi:large subunit ribosomal protein L19